MEDVGEIMDAEEHQDKNKVITPLPKLQLFLMILVQLAESINVNILFPFVAFMVEDMGYTGSRLGTYAGGLAASFCGAQFCSAVLWGWFSDRYGRKPALVLGTLGASLGIIIFGTARNYSQAMIGRILSGLLCGNVGSLKSFLSEITDQTNRGAAFSYVSAAWSLGTMFAPVAGGLLCKPADKYPNYFSKQGIFGEFPYLLPCVICAVWGVFSSLMCLVFLVEARKVEPLSSLFMSKDLEMVSIEKSSIENGYAVSTKQKSVQSSTKYMKLSNFEENGDDDEIEEENISFNLNDLNDINEESYVDETKEWNDKKETSDNKNKTKDEENDDKLEYDENDVLECSFLFASSKCLCSWKFIKESSKIPENETKNKETIVETKSKKKLHVLSQKVVLIAVAVYGMLSMGIMLFDETLPLFLKLSTKEGGISFSSSQIGLLLSLSGGVILIFAMTSLPSLLRNYSKSWLYKISILSFIPALMIYPTLTYLNKYIFQNTLSQTVETFVIWGILIALGVCKGIVCTLAFTCVSIQMNHSVFDKHLGTVNGLGQSVVSLSRAIGPALGGILFSLSISSGFIYLNFIAATLCLLISLWLSSQLPLWLENRRQEWIEKMMKNENNKKSESDKGVLEA